MKRNIGIGLIVFGVILDIISFWTLAQGEYYASIGAKFFLFVSVILFIVGAKLIKSVKQ